MAGFKRRIKMKKVISDVLISTSEAWEQVLLPIGVGWDLSSFSISSKAWPQKPGRVHSVQGRRG